MTHCTLPLAAVLLLLLLLGSLECGASRGATEDDLEHLWHPPRAWNSWDSMQFFANQSTAIDVAIMFKALSGGGFDTVVLDEGWAQEGSVVPNHGSWLLDEYARPMPNVDFFPSARDGLGLYTLSKYLREMYGVRLGLWHINGITKAAVDRKLKVYGTNYTVDEVIIPDKTCPWHKDMHWVNVSHPGGRAYYESLISLFHSWGVSYLKFDCIYGERDIHPDGLVALTDAVRNVAPEMTISLSPGEQANVEEAVEYGQRASLYRVTNDLWDSWWSTSIPSVLNQTFVLRDYAALLDAPQRDGRGKSFPDPDMLPLGDVKADPNNDAPMHLSAVTTPHSARYIYGMWSITKSPIVLGGSVRSILATDYLRNLFNNTAMYEMSRHGVAPRVLAFRDEGKDTECGGYIVWGLSQGNDKSGTYVGFFAFSRDFSASCNVTIPLEYDDILGKKRSHQSYKVYDVINEVHEADLFPLSRGSITKTVRVNDAVILLLHGV